MMHRVFSLLIGLLCLPASSWCQNYLFENGRSTYSIILGDEASQTEQTAARELQQYLKAIGGVTLPITTEHATPGIYVGWSPEVHAPKPQADDQTYRYYTKDGNLYIYGGRDFGTMYGVFSFLENELGVRWYTSSYTKIPKLTSKKLANLDISQSPCIARRLDFYNDALFHHEWCAHNKLNEINSLKQSPYGNYTKYWGIHTFFTLLPPGTYFDTHPEYYSLKGGKRIRNGQLCLSNKKMRAVLLDNLLDVIAKNPGYWCYDVSQNDNGDYCQCPKCTKLARKYGGQSGAMIWFVNKLAAKVRKTYPDVKIGTFAYMYTRHAPQKIKPASNVVVRLCNVECCFAHPLKSLTCPKNQAFMQDLRDWSCLTDRIYIWDYVADFVEYQTPYPNFRILGDNIRTFGENGVLGLMEEGSHDAPWTEFSELRQWVLAKLLWNPNQNVDALAREFCMDYYGKAGADVYTYWSSVQNLVAEDTHIHFNSRARDLWYSDKFIEQSITSLEQAVGRCGGDKVLTQRVKRVLAQVYFVYVCRHYAQSLTNGRYKALKKILEDDPTIVRENKYDLDKYLKDSGYT